MKISLKWLSEFFPALDFEKDILPRSSEIITKLPLAGLEIGSCKQLDKGLSKVIVAQVISMEKHPQADKLNVCQVEIVPGGRRLQIVCGASNVRPGMKVPVAVVGAVLPGNFEIKQANIRGIDSFGMICSQKELGLGEESGGIWHLPESAPVGSLLTKAVGLNDQIWEAEPTPDRADCLSHLGVAREVGPFFNLKPQIQELDVFSESAGIPLVNVEVQDPGACPIYTAQLFDGVTQTKTADWMVRLLTHLGLRSHNAIVDITNYCLMELGHPLHAFDADKIAGSKILVRRARPGEKLLTLDGVERQLSVEDLVIADLEGPMALAGVMGGLNSSVTESTQRFVLESALFDPKLVQAMAQRHRIHSDASHRFERGVDSQGVQRSAARASFLFKKLCGARRKGGLKEIFSKEAESERNTLTHIHLDLRALKNHTGIETKVDELRDVFQKVQISSQVKTANVLKVEVPTHRLDLQREIDLVEEAARLLGYDRIPVVYPFQNSQSSSSTAKLYQKIQLIRQRILETGLTEMMPYSFVSEKERALLPQAKLVELANPLSQDWKYLRPNLSFALTGVLAHHASMGQLRGSFFDIGHVFSVDSNVQNEDISESQLKMAAGHRQHPQTKDSLSTRTRESLHVAWALMGQRQTLHWSSNKSTQDYKASVDFFDAKAIAEKMAQDLSVFDSRFAQLSFVPLSSFLQGQSREVLEKSLPWLPIDWLHPHRAAVLCLPARPPGIPVGFVGEIHPALRNDLLNLPAAKQLSAVLGEVCVVEDLFEEGAKFLGDKTPLMNPRGKMTLSRRVPIVERDLALVVDAKVSSSDLEKVMRRAEPHLLQDMACVDVFVLPEGKVSLAYRLWLQGSEKTLEDAEIQAVMSKLLKAAKDKYKAELR